MNNKLNYSTLEEVWGPNPVSTIPSHVLREKENVIKKEENHINIEPVQEFIQSIRQPVIEPMTNASTEIEHLKPCMLIEKHLQNCEICSKKFNNNIENYENYENLKETFENITPSQKNLLIIIIYGILIILISDLIIKDTNV